MLRLSGSIIRADRAGIRSKMGFEYSVAEVFERSKNMRTQNRVEKCRKIVQIGSVVCEMWAVKRSGITAQEVLQNTTAFQFIFTYPYGPTVAEQWVG